MARIGESSDLLKCSFCGKSQKQVKKLIAGPQVYICDECIDLCNEIIEELSAYADYVLWDTPPAGFLPDATVVAHETDALLFVVGAQARRSAARESLSNLRESGANVIGVAANRVAPMGGSYYYYYYYYYSDYADEPDGRSRGTRNGSGTERKPQDLLDLKATEERGPQDPEA